MAQNVDVFENALTKATDFKEIRVITSDNKSQSVTKEKFVELIDALVVARLKTLNIENNPTGIVVQNGTRFGSMTPQNLASVLGAVEYNHTYQTKDGFYAACANKFIWAGVVTNIGYFLSIQLVAGQYLMFYFIGNSLNVKYGNVDETAASWRAI